jgi:uncharacterized protein with HEPN domain
VVPWGLLAELEEELGRPVDVAKESALDPLIRDRVLQEAIPLGRTTASILAESTRRIGDGLKAQHPEIDWRE